MTVFPALFYTSAREIPTLLYTSSLKKVPLSGGASPYSRIELSGSGNEAQIGSAKMLTLHINSHFHSTVLPRSQDLAF